MIKRRLVGQFANPHGVLGWVAGRVMSKRESNVVRTLATVDLLGLSSRDRVLEIGHGPGVGLAAALAVSDDVVGLEQSTAMRSMAARRNRMAIDEGRLALVVGDAQHPPPELEGFDAIFSSNVWQFWADQVATLAAWHDRLAPGGTMAVTFRPPLTGATEDEALAAGERIVAQLRETGYVDARLELIPIGDVPAVCGLGRRS